MKLEPGEKSKYIPKFGTADAADLIDGEDMEHEEALTISGTTHSTDEAGLRVVISRKLRHQMKADSYRAAGLVVGNGLGRKIDEDSLALFSGLSGGVGSAGTTFTMGYIAAAVSQLMGQSEPAPLPYRGLVHPHTFNAIVDYFATPGTTNIPPDLQKKAMQEYWRFNDPLYGVPMLVDGNITIDSADDMYGAIFAEMCFIYLKGYGVTSWVEYKNSLRGWEIGIVADYAMVEEDDGYGRYLLFDAAVPTS